MRDSDVAGGFSRRGARAFFAARRVVRMLAPIVPALHRAEWRDEWESELWHQVSLDEQTGPLSTRAWLDLACRTAGALPHALSLLRNEWRFEMIVQDLVYAIRSAMKRASFTALVVGMLAIGIGANTAMFTVVNSVLLSPLPFDGATELVAMNGSFANSTEAAISGPDFLDYRADAPAVFASFSGYQTDQVVLTGKDEPERVRAARVTPEFFATLHVQPVAGRPFMDDEQNGAGHDVAIISWALWQRRFHGEPNVVGSTVDMDGRPMAIVGVAPPVLDRTLGWDVYKPFEFKTPNTSVRRFHGMRGIARLKPGVTIEQARVAMDGTAKRLQATYPENATWTLRLRPYQELIVGSAQRSLSILLGAVGLVLLIACGNVANLLLARATARQAEIGIRAALGASRGRLVRQLLTESLVLSGAGGLLGFGLGVLLVRGVKTFGAALVPRLEEVTISPAVMVFAGALAVGTGLLFGLAPALHAARANLATTFAGLGRGSSSRRSVWMRNALVTVQVALSVVLLVSAGLLMRTLWALEHVSPGFDADHVLTAQIGLPLQRYGTHDAQLRFWTSLIDGVRATPGVTNVSATTMLPMAGGNDTYFWRADKPPATPKDRRNAMISVVDESYFSTMHIPVLSGRAFGAQDRGGNAKGIILNKRLAGRLFDPGENPVGKHLVVDFGQPFDGEIVGVVDDVRSNGPANNAPPTLYFPVQQPEGFGANYFAVVIRTSGNPADATSALRKAVASIDRDIPLMRVRTMEEVVGATTSDTLLAARMLGAFAAIALLLAVTGLYGVLSYAVAQRARELGIRMAFGARAGQVFSMVLRRGMAIVAGGLALGLIGAFLATRLMSSMLFQVGRTDPWVFGFVTVTLAVTGVVACAVPARRATKLDPVTALRGD